MQSALVLAVTALLGMVQEKDNPAFKYWSEWGIGSNTKYKMEMDQAGQKMEMETTMKLLEKAEGKVVVESSGKMKIGGNEIATPPQKQEIKAKEAADKFKIDKEGDEEIEVAGKKLKCHWVEMTQEAGGKKMTVKAWMSKDIPGGMAKSEMTPEGAAAPMMKMVALEWEKK
jgi:hypothetical protein